MTEEGIRMKNLARGWFLPPLLGLMLACSFPTLASPTLSPTEGAPASTATPFLPGDGLERGADYPDTPEGVVLAFLNAYQEDPEQMSRYLSRAWLGLLPESGGASLLEIDGDLEGFAIQSAAVSLEPPGAVIVTGIQAGGVETLRRFTLGKEDGYWVVLSIETEEV